MQLPDYNGFNTGRERNDAIRELVEEIEACECPDYLEELKRAVECLKERLKAELDEGKDHWMDYAEYLDQTFYFRKYYLTHRGEFRWN